MNDEINRYASDAQLVLARLYRIVTIVGLTIVAVAFVLYVSGFLETSVPVKEVVSYWHLDAESYAEQTGTPVGWEFLSHLARGESLSFGSLVLMALAVIISLSIMVTVFMRKGRSAYAVIVLLQTIILVIAATGIVSGH